MPRSHRSARAVRQKAGGPMTHPHRRRPLDGEATRLRSQSVVVWRRRITSRTLQSDNTHVTSALPRTFNHAYVSPYRPDPRRTRCRRVWILRSARAWHSVGGSGVAEPQPRAFTHARGTCGSAFGPDSLSPRGVLWASWASPATFQVDRHPLRVTPAMKAGT